VAGKCGEAEWRRAGCAFRVNLALQLLKGSNAMLIQMYGHSFSAGHFFSSASGLFI
tara:strand:+ start:2115 stop:2282 length:168 start_codon:yes stop_codon:yes gene_type:complete